MAQDNPKEEEEEEKMEEEEEEPLQEDEEQPKTASAVAVTFQEPEQPPQDVAAADANASPRAQLRRVSARSFYNKQERPDHLEKLVRHRRQSVKYMDQMLDISTTTTTSSSSGPLSSSSSVGELHDSQKEALKEAVGFMKTAMEYSKEEAQHFPQNRARLEVRLEEFSYLAKAFPEENAIKTVYNQSPVYKLVKAFKRCCKSGQGHGGGKKEQEYNVILDRINLVLKPGKMYLVLGPPSSGKTSLLKAIAGRLSKENGELVEGSVEYNGLVIKDNQLAFGGKILKMRQSQIHIENAIAFVEQIDQHAPRLTVKETFDFAFQCRSGGTHARARQIPNEAAKEWVEQVDAQDAQVNLTMEGLGIKHVADTFVGDNDVRGVSGGQRRRVTVGEMFQGGTSVLCGDEISTGLDAASTYDMVNILMQYTRIAKMTRVISLLQPSPETVSLFDEIILISGGMILYAGPLPEVESYFANLGYTAPDSCDVADFLQMLSTSDGEALFDPSGNTDSSETSATSRTEPYSMEELADAFRASDHGKRIGRALKQPWTYGWASHRFNLEGEDISTSQTGSDLIDMSSLETKYFNGFWRSTYINMKRAFVLWTRDRRYLIVNAIKNAVMGLSVGGVFWQTDDPTSIFGVLFQGMLFIMLGAMVSAPGQVDDRTIYYRHCDANFYPAMPYVIGRAISAIPEAITDVVLFGTILYFMVGLAKTAQNYFVFIALLFVFTLVMNQQLNIFAATASTKSMVQGLSAVVLLFSMLFGGFIVSPAEIPNYYIWIYWWNPMAWAFRGLVVNEFRSGDWDETVTLANGDTINEADHILKSKGFTINGDFTGEAFGQEWVGYAFAYLCPYIVLCVWLTGLGLIFVRVAPAETGMTGTDDQKAQAKEKMADEPEETMDLEFTPVNLTFTDVCYEVKASTGNDTLMLLNNINGYFLAGRMCALMGSSGAGKTTLMDVIALRKSTGTVTGDIRINGFEQEAKSFRRCSGYVEQFDVQAPELTVRETVLFSARLRLDSSDPAVATDEEKQQFVDGVLNTLELTTLADSVVGTYEEGGLSFEQKKRLSIAVELAASPSIIFLDEPTSGLDARAAMIVVSSLRRISDTGRTVIATIHQPSSAVFNLFDDLLLLKKGGRVVFFGELGDESCRLVDYFEARGAEPISRGENPANWMLKVIGGGIDEGDLDYAREYLKSEDREAAMSKISEINQDPDPEQEVKFDSEYAAPARLRKRLLSQRLQTIYWRSPTYNLARMVISAVTGFILGSIFLYDRLPSVLSETRMTSLFGVIFLSFIINGVLAITSVLPVMLSIRDVFYRHQAAGMVDYTSLALALSVGEQFFIVLSSALFAVIFIPCSGITTRVGSGIAYWGFFTFNAAIYSYFGQAFMCLVRTMATAQILCSIFIGLNNFFSGFIVRPQFLEGIFKVSMYITPGSYVYEGMIVALYKSDNRTVTATPGGEFYEYLGCNNTLDCSGNVTQFVDYFFGGEYELDNGRIARNAIILGAFLVAARISTWLGLKYFRYTST